MTDACGNSTTHIQEITSLDTVPPVFTVPADATISCDTDPNDLTQSGDVLDESDNCDSNIGEAVYLDSLVTAVPCDGSSMIYRTWSLTDACGNYTSAVQQIALLDTTPPLFTVPPDLTLGCEGNANDLTVTGDVIDESDNCDPNIGEAVYSDSLIVGDPCPLEFDHLPALGANRCLWQLSLANAGVGVAGYYAAELYHSCRLDCGLYN